MTEVTIITKARRVGNSVGVVIPASAAREAHIRPGMDVEVRLRRTTSELLGFAKDLYDGPFDRNKEGLWRDRI